MKRKYPCVVCGYRTLPGYKDWDVCPVCFWEDDVQGDADETSPANRGMSVSEAQANFMKFGACEREMRKHVRPPRPSEKRASDWKPFDRALAILAGKGAIRKFDRLAQQAKEAESLRKSQEAVRTFLHSLVESPKLKGKARRQD